MKSSIRKKREKIEDRLDRIVTIYETLERFLDDLPDEVPSRVKQWTIERIMEDEELSELIQSIKDRRATRLLVVGRTGAGKSTVINAICGQYVAEISDVKVGTQNAQKYSYKSFGKTIFEVIDTQGYGDGTIDDESNIPDDLEKTINEFEPDAILFLQKSDERGYRQNDVKIVREIQEVLGRDLPVIAIASQVDKLEPARTKDPDEYPDRKMNNIKEVVDQLEDDLIDDGIDPIDVLGVSSYVEWDTDPTAIEDEAKREHLSIEFDGRYNIDTLIDLLEDNIDLEAGIMLMLAARLDTAVRDISDRFINNFAVISGMIGTTPLPLSDIFVLTPMQITLIMLIAYLGGREFSYDSAKELLMSIGVAGPAGFGLRMIFQQGTKLANLLYPGAGSALSGSIAAGGTYGIGKASKAYFLKNRSEDELRTIMEDSAREYRQSEAADQFK